MPGAGQLPDFEGRALLERVLGRGDRRPFDGTELEHLLFGCFRPVLPPGGELPYGALRRLGEGGPPDDRVWLQADPVALRPDRDRLLLFDMVDFGLDDTEMAGLVRAFNDHFSSDGLRLEAGAFGRHGYLAVPRPPRIRTSTLGEAFGRNVDMFLPRGDEALEWHRLLNEVQMLFHGLELNEARREAGRMPVGGLWFSGAGVLPGVSACFDLVVADEPLALGLARAAGTPVRPLAAAGTLAEDEGGELLLVDDRLQRPAWQADPTTWFDGLAGFARRLDAWVNLLGSGRFREVRLYPGGGRVHVISNRALRRFWRRRHPLSDYLLAG